MPISTTRVAIDRPERYIKQLVSHLGQRADAELGADGRGVILFEHGRCVLTPHSKQLAMIAEATDVEALNGVQDVVARHLVRFANNEELSVDWAEPASGGSLQLVHPVVNDYLHAHSTPADDVLPELVAETREATGGAAGMQIAQDEGALLGMLVRLAGARRAVEIGVFTGYSSTCIAKALPKDGYLLACDVSEEWTTIARRYWERTGVAERIDLRIGPAVETLRALPEEPTFDFAFIDADKVSYPAYYDEVVPRLNAGGLVVVDNAFQGGRTFDPAFDDDSVRAVRQVNDAIHRDARVESVMLPVRDGIVLARKL